MTEPDRLPDDLLDYLNAAREPEPVAPETRARLLARIGPLLPPDGGGTPGGDGGAGPVPGAESAGPALGAGGAATTAATAGAGFFQGKLAVAAVSAILGAAGGATMHATFAPPKTVIVSATVAATSAPPSDLPLAPASALAAPSEEAPAPSASVAVAPPSSASAEVPGVRKSTMRAERILLEAANAAIIRGDYAAAIASLQQHKQTYPRGELAQERDILMAQANKLKAAGSPP